MHGRWPLWPCKIAALQNYEKKVASVKSLRILTNIDANHGSCIFNVALNRILASSLPEHDIKFLDSIPLSWRMYEWLRLFKPNRRIPLHNLKRYRNLMAYSREHLRVERFPGSSSYEGLMRRLREREYDALVVAKVVWDIAMIWQNPRFPNIFWISEDIPAKKIAYAVSGHRTNLELFERHKDDVKRILSGYSLIGVRDDMTEHIVKEAGVDELVPVHRMSDPAFLFEHRAGHGPELRARFGLHPEQPVLGLLFYGKQELAARIREHYHARGYQIVNLSMYNPAADINLGHRLNPDEWVSMFSELEFCITDRFHCSIFCLRNNVPFAGIEPYAPAHRLNSKVYSLLQDFQLCEPCYHNPYEPGFDAGRFLDACDGIQRDWEDHFAAPVRARIEQQTAVQRRFVEAMQGILG